MTHIKITGQHKLNGEWITWVKSVPSKWFTFIKVNGVNMAYTKRNYYLDSKQGKIRYKTIDCNNASYEHLYIVYGEIADGVYAYCGTETNNHIDEKLAYKSGQIKALPSETTKQFMNNLVGY